MTQGKLKIQVATVEQPNGNCPTTDNTTSSGEKEDADFDPWVLPELKDDGVKWSELTTCRKILRVTLSILKIAILLLLLYIFVCSLDFLSSAFRLIGGKAAGGVLSKNELLSNPVVGLMIGVLVTVLVQSSSTSTSIVITMVGAELISVRNAIPIVMGANIGTSVTNTIVSLMQASERNEFRRAFAAATVHDMFNWLTVIVLLPIEEGTGYLFRLTEAILSTGNWEQNEHAEKDFLKKLTKPLTKKIIQLDKSVITAIAKQDESAMNMSLVKRCCKKNGTECIKNCEFLLQGLDWSDSLIGVLMLVLSLIILCACLMMLVKLLHTMLKGRIAVIIKKTVNANPRFPFSELMGYLAILIGAAITVLVQSSSIFTSALTPLAGLGVISLERMYPLTLGSNIGTTATGMLAALAADKKHIAETLQLALCHLFFNISGIILFFPLPFLRFPIRLAKILGNTTAKYRWFSMFYLFMMFLILPGIVFGLSAAGTTVLLAVGIPILIIGFLVVVINIIQRKKPTLLPKVLRDWNWLPECLHSLDPIDRLISRMLTVCSCCRACCQTNNSAPGDKGPISSSSEMNILDSHTRVSPSNGVENKAFNEELKTPVIESKHM
ncbi:sodium-dependent phosphate transport protein 2B-like [Limulus polyphemus]|uniref:Sodium-dependent phosphate transport protein 2B-like n=1 Tax=Limulus polyphemus TaxID=6850 RepID=A0ABM1B977_LIMPO|nr:sodium-dependent phosphate transport protein 2B-like [Limulus polyphemus]